MDSVVAEAFPRESYAIAPARETERAMTSWAEEILTPAQFFTSATDTAIAWSGERKLSLAVLRDAVDSFFRYRNDPTTRGQRLFRTLPARVLDFRVSLSLSVNALGRRMVFPERWHGLSELR
jgi:hypothetical protein